MSELYQLPDGWEWMRLSSLLDVQNGYAFDSKLFNEDVGCQLIRIRDLKNGIKTEVKFSGSYDNKFLVYKGDFLIGMDGDFVCYQWNGESSLLNQRVCRLVNFNHELHARYIFYGINKYLHEIHSVTAFVTVKHISSKQIKDIQFPVPPLAEQKRIVQKLDALFERVDKAIALLQKNIDAADSFMNSVLNDVFSDLEQNHPYVELDKTVDFGGKNIMAINNPDLIYLSLEDIEANTGKIINYRTVSEAGVIGTSVLFDNDCILYSKLRPYLNKVTVPDVNGCATTELVVIKPHNNLFKYFVSYFLRNPMVVNFLNNDSMGTKMPRTNMKTFKKLNIPVPEYGRQVKVVAYLDNISAQIEQVKSAQQQKMHNLLNLKSSILDQAFHGKL